MSSRSTLLGVVVVLALSGLVAQELWAQTGHTSWQSWRFDWGVEDGAGMVLRQVDFQDRRILRKASLPVVRIEPGQSQCGPYQARISWANLVSVPGCGEGKVCQRSFIDGQGRAWLELGVLARLGIARLYHAWYFSQDGWIHMRVWNQGFACKVDHDLHAYWRLDFQLNSSSAEQVFVYETGSPDEGWGPGWHRYRREQNEVRNPAAERKWFVRQNQGQQGVWVLPDQGQAANLFSSKDIALRRYRSQEDEPWPFGARGHLGYDNDEDIQDQDVIVWYVSHWHHDFQENPQHWNGTGPWLKVQ